MRDVGERKPDVRRVQRRIGHRRQRFRHLRLHQHQAAEQAPFRSDLSSCLEVDAADAIGRARGDAWYVARRRRIGDGIGAGCRLGRGGDVLRFARVVLFGLEQCRRYQQMAIEQLPLGADLGGPVLFRAEDLI